MLGVSSFKSKIAATRRGLCPKLVEGYARLYEEHGATHEITISLGIHPRSFDPETEFLPHLRKVVREITRATRGIPKRKALALTPEEAVFVGGFYEPTDAAGMLFPHFHGVVALGPHDEWWAREALIEHVGEDTTYGAGWQSVLTRGRTCITIPGAKPTFHLRAFDDASGLRRYVSYANKAVRFRDPVHWTTHDILHRS